MLVVQTELPDPGSSSGTIPEGDLHVQPAASQTSHATVKYRLVLNTK